MMIKERHRYTFHQPAHVLPGDILKCTIQDRNTKQEYMYQEHIGRELVVDTVVTFDVPKDIEVLGTTNGIGAIFGKALDPKEPSPCQIANLVPEDKEA